MKSPPNITGWIRPWSHPSGPVTSWGHQEGRRVFWEGAKFFKLGPIVSNYIQQIFPGWNVFLGTLCPPGYEPEWISGFQVTYIKPTALFCYSCWCIQNLFCCIGLYLVVYSEQSHGKRRECLHIFYSRWFAWPRSVYFESEEPVNRTTLSIFGKRHFSEDTTFSATIQETIFLQLTEKAQYIGRQTADCEITSRLLHFTNALMENDSDSIWLLLAIHRSGMTKKTISQVISDLSHGRIIKKVNRTDLFSEVESFVQILHYQFVGTFLLIKSAE